MQIKKIMLGAKHNASYVLKANKYRPKSLECYFKTTNLVQSFAQDKWENKINQEFSHNEAKAQDPVDNAWKCLMVVKNSNNMLCHYQHNFFLCSTSMVQQLLVKYYYKNCKDIKTSVQF